MAYIADDLENIRAAIASGEKSVQFSDRSVTYRSIAELIEAERIISAALADPRDKQTFGYATKGL